MSKLLEWKFAVINDSLDKLFVLVEKMNIHGCWMT